MVRIILNNKNKIVFFLIIKLFDSLLIKFENYLWIVKYGKFDFVIFDLFLFFIMIV